MYQPMVNNICDSLKCFIKMVDWLRRVIAASSLEGGGLTMLVFNPLDFRGKLVTFTFTCLISVD